VAIEVSISRFTPILIITMPRQQVNFTRNEFALLLAQVALATFLDKRGPNAELEALANGCILSLLALPSCTCTIALFQRSRRCAFIHMIYRSLLSFELVAGFNPGLVDTSSAQWPGELSRTAKASCFLFIFTNKCFR